MRVDIINIINHIHELILIIFSKYSKLLSHSQHFRKGVAHDKAHDTGDRSVSNYLVWSLLAVKSESFKSIGGNRDYAECKTAQSHIPEGLYQSVD